MSMSWTTIFGHANNMAEMKLDMAKMKSEIIKWVAGMLVAQTGLIAALVKLL